MREREKKKYEHFMMDVSMDKKWTANGIYTEKIQTISRAIFRFS
jgi:hypothetical protein